MSSLPCPCPRNDAWRRKGAGVKAGWQLASAATIAALVLWLIAAASIPVQADPGRHQAVGTAGRLRLTPSDAIVPLGHVVTIEVWLEDVADYYGMDLRLSFDPALLQVPMGRVTPLWEVLHPTEHFVIKNEVDNSGGTVWYAVTNINPSEPFTGTGRIGAIGFLGTVWGTSQLRVTYAKGSTRDGLGMFPEKEDVTLTVIADEHFSLTLPLVICTVGTS